MEGEFGWEVVEFEFGSGRGHFRGLFDSPFNFLKFTCDIIIMKIDYLYFGLETLKLHLCSRFKIIISSKLDPIFQIEK
mgnify:CR=1 FL=1